MFALVAAGAALFTLVAGAVLLLVLAFRVGLVLLVAGLAVFGLLATLLAIGAFLYVRRPVPRRVERRIERAREQARGSRTEHGRDARDEDATMTEEEAIDHLRDQYAEREITIREFEAALEEIVRSDDHGTVIREHGRDSERESDREYEQSYELE